MTPDGPTTMMVLGPSGELPAKHRWTHLCDVDVPSGVQVRESTTCTPRHQATTCPLPTGEAVLVLTAPHSAANGGNAISGDAQGHVTITSLRFVVVICYDV